jgi:hypothetical protein
MSSSKSRKEYFKTYRDNNREEYIQLTKLRTPPEVTQRLEEEFQPGKKPDDLTDKAYGQGLAVPEDAHKEEAQERILRVQSKHEF